MKCSTISANKTTLTQGAYEGVQRVETFPVPEEALREALLNAVAHKDSATGAPIRISVYDDRIMLWNPGQLPPDWTAEGREMADCSG
jgi:ATP-dependent DNA helicase RecG